MSGMVRRVGVEWVVIAAAGAMEDPHAVAETVNLRHEIIFYSAACGIQRNRPQTALRQDCHVLSIVLGMKSTF